MNGRDRLILALDIPTVDSALALVDRLDNVTFFKVGWQLFMTGEMFRLLERLRGRNVFIDLKVPGDIVNTVSAVIDACIRFDVKFLTLSESMPLGGIHAATKARGNRPYPKLLTVPLLSSMDEGDLSRMAGVSRTMTLDDYVFARATAAIEGGCDGVIASGDAISLCRTRFGSAIVIVSPGIRPAGSASDDHKRHTTPGEAIRRGADYLVVGRPISQARDPRDAAQRIIEEIDASLKERSADATHA